MDDLDPLDETRDLASGDLVDSEGAKLETIPETIGRYRIDKVLGKGGFGLVYLAYDDQLNRPVAIKVPHGQLITKPSDAEAYLTEAHTVANLDHPHIVPVHDVGSTDDYPCFVVSKYVEGTDLSQKLKLERLTYTATAELAATVAEALHYAHKQGLVHRDVKPGNILLDTDGKPYVVDFGLALREENIGKGPRHAGTTVYMSPEQARGEGHRVDGRSDIFSLGVVLYEMLVGRRPFQAETQQELLEQIATMEAKPPRQFDDAVPKELERICLKAISKRASDRYTTALDFADDLRHFLEQRPAGSEAEACIADAARTTGSDSTRIGADSDTPKVDSDSQPIRIVPKGLRSFDAHDADFFLELLPGPRDREGLPDSLRFWKTRIEETDPDDTFSIGLIYGPSGCGKSSLVKAGLLPRLSEDVISVYVEATPDDTETRLLHRLRKHCPTLADNLNLKETMAALRRGQGIPTGKKVLIVLDQFEQWLHAKKEEENAELVQALRQCDGGRVQCIVTVRDDFWMAATRFMRELEIRLVEAQNSAAVDLFPVRHAHRVLSAFGRAFGALSEESNSVSNEQKEFLKQSVAGLAEENKVICVRLALFAEMMKGKSWTSATLKDVGGTEGVGVTFLEETFGASTAPPEHRLHQKAARAVLKALLPDSGTDIKGEMKSYDELLEASGYATRPKDFDDLIKILDSEIRLITPTDPEGVESENDSDSPFETGQKYYQLTHDYLVPSLREWLTRKQRETRRGRAELLLAERSSTWNTKRENRQLPSTLEWLRIRSLTKPNNWTIPQRTMMNRANRVKGIFWSSVLAVLIVTGIGIQQAVSGIQRQTAQRSTTDTVNTLRATSGNAIQLVLNDLDELPRDLVLTELRDRFPKAAGQQKLNLAYGLAHFEQVEIDAIVSGLINEDTEPEEVDNIVLALKGDETGSLASLKTVAEQASDSKNWSIKARLAIAAMHLGDESLAAEMLRDQPEKTNLSVELPDLLADFRKQVKEIAELPGEQRNSAESLLKLAVAHYFLDQEDRALVELEQLAKGGSANWEVWLRMAICQARAGKAEAAKKSIEQLSRIPRTQSLIAYAKIMVEASLGNLPGAEKQLDELITGSPDNANAQYNAACVAAQLVRVCRQKQLADENRFKQLALQLLRTAYQDLGYDGSSGINIDPDFIPLHLDQDFLDLVSELKPPAQTWDPIQRTVFIREFAQWSGSVERLAPLLANTDNPALRSGICLGMGSVKKPGQTAKDAWQPVLNDWHMQAKDSGTHGASSWALSQWKLDLPSIEESKAPPNDRDWWQPANGLRFARITGGNVTGEDGPIIVDHDYWLSDREITVGMFQRFMADEEYHKQNPEIKPDWDGAYVFENDDSPDLPVQQVSWFDAVMFCNWLSWKLDLEPCYEIKKSKPPERDADQQQDQKGGQPERIEPYEVTWRRDANGIRLPTEGEWEFACRAATTTRFSFGDDESLLVDYGWFDLNSISRTHPTQEKLCNAGGLFDMHGNVREWCWDEIGGSFRVFRGGCWHDTAWSCQSSFRYRLDPSSRSDNLGFRVARGPSSQASESSK